MNRHAFRHLRLLVTLLVLSLMLGVGLSTPTIAAPPHAEVSLEAVAVNVSEVDLTWTLAADSGAVTAVILRAGKELGRVEAATSHYVDATVEPAHPYTYVVELLDAVGNRVAHSKPAQVKTPELPETDDALPPSSPVDFTVTPTSGGILLDWYDASDDTDVAGYRILRDGELLATVNAATLSYLDETADPAIGHSYTIEAIDVVGKRSEPQAADAPAYERSEAPAPAAEPEAAESGVAQLAAVGYAPQLLRYPYLTDLVDKYATINWGTDRSAMSGSAKWGPVEANGSCNPTHTVEATRAPTMVNGVGEYQWKAMLTLEPGKQYCYRVFLKSVDLLGSDPSPRFWTQVPAGSTEPFSFVVFGDWGYTEPNGQNPHQANLMREIAETGARFGFTTGDNGYQSGSQKNFGDLVQVGPAVSGIFGPQFWTIPGRSMALFPATGNHGYASSNAAHPHMLTWPQDRAAMLSNGKYERKSYCCLNGTIEASYPAAYYAFDAGNARFYVLDTAWADANVGLADLYKNDYDYHWTPTSEEYQWLERDLAAHPDKIKFAVFHFPLYSDSSAQASDTHLQGPNSLEGLLGRYGVKFAFNGHAHLYERNHPNADGLVTYVTGGGGAKVASVNHCRAFDAYAIGWSFTSNRGSSCNAPIPSGPEQVYHFLHVTVNGNTVTVAPTDELGRTFDVVTYTVGSGGTADTQAPSAPGTLTATATSSTQVDLSWTAANDNVGVAGYTIYRDGAPIAEVGEVTQYTDTSVQPATPYQYQVRARDAAGNVSSISPTASVTTPGASGATTMTFTAEADSYVAEAALGFNFGTRPTLLIDSSPNRQAYVSFNVTGLTGTVQSATLRLFVTDSTSDGPQVFTASANDWSETSLTWRTQPGPSGEASDDLGSVRSGTWAELDVTPLVGGNGAVSFVLVPTSSNGLDVSSREGTQAPQLVITTE